MATAIEILQATGVFMVGLFARGGIFLVAALALAIPAAAIAVAARAVGAARRRAVVASDGIEYRRAAFHAPSHTWLAERAKGELDVGIDEVARAFLPSATSIELPAAGTVVRRGETVATVHAGRHAVPIVAPVDGRIVRVNRGVRSDPESVRREPNARWLFSLAPANEDYEKFPYGSEAKGWLAGERARLAAFVAGELGLAAADGGELPAPTPGAIGEEGWRRAVSSFLGPRA
jgi:glycine cleavage system H protein